MNDDDKMEEQAEDLVVSPSELRALKKRVRKLERLLAEKEMQAEILREGIKLMREQNLISRTPLPFEEDSLEND